jgi:hypothetical protein
MFSTDPTPRSVVEWALDGSICGLMLLYGLLQSNDGFLATLLQNCTGGLALSVGLMLMFSALFSILSVFWALSWGDEKAT